MNKRQAGITLIELMTVMVIVAILAAIAIPSYRNYVIRTNRTEAKTALLQASAQMERCFTQNNRYDVGCDVTFPILTPAGNYSISPTAAVTATDFSLTATPINGQVADTQCGAFILDSANRQTVSGTQTRQQCWSR